MNADMKWLDNPEVFRVNRLDAHSDHCYYKDYEDIERNENSLLQSCLLYTSPSPRDCS